MLVIPFLHEEPDHPLTQEHLPGATHIPPLSQFGSQIAIHGSNQFSISYIITINKNLHVLHVIPVYPSMQEQVSGPEQTP